MVAIVPTPLLIAAVPPLKVDVRLVLLPIVIVVLPASDAVGASTTVTVTEEVSVSPAAFVTVSV